MFVSNRWLRAVSAVSFAALCVAAAGCNSPTVSDSTSASAAASITRAGVHITLEVTPAVVAPSEPVTVRLTLTNTAQRPAEMLLGCTSPLESLGVRGSEQQTLAYLIQTGCFTALGSLRLAAGESHTVEVALSAEDARDLAGVRPLLPGRYLIDAIVSLREVNGAAVERPTLQAGFSVR